MRGELPNFTLEKRYLRKDGSLIWVELFAALQREAAGKPAYAIAIVLDISERKRLEAELSQAHARLELAVRGSNITILELNMPDGVLENGRWEVVVFSDQARGYDRSDWATEFAVAMARVHPEDRKQVDRAMRAHLTGQTRDLKADMGLDAAQEGMAGASAILGCIPGAMCAGFLSDRFGRKKMLFLCAALFAVSGIFSAQYPGSSSNSSPRGF